MNTAAAPADELSLDVILGRCDDMRAEVYVRVVGLPPVPAMITGTVAGPESRFAITLPATAALVDLGPSAEGTSAVARAILTEPAYWTPELPARYRLQAAVVADGRTLAACDRLVGLRRLGVRGRSLWLEGRRWVPRGGACEPGAFSPAALRESLAVAVVGAPADPLCDAADEWGVGLVAWCGDDPVADCLRWARHPSVMLAVLPRDMAPARGAEYARDIGPIKGTMLLGLEVEATRPPAPVPAGIEFLVVAMPESALPHPAWREVTGLPLVAMRPAGGAVETRRQACDRLQADLAGWRGDAPAAWDWAGYLVS